MSPRLSSVRPARTVFRVGRRPDPWAWPDWSYAAPNGTFGNRWDDPSASYRVLYACSERVGAFVETLARFRPDLELIADLRAIEGSDDFLLAGVVPLSWLETRVVGSARLHGRFANVGDAESLATFRQALVSRAIHHNVAELDAAAIRLSAPRAFTQEISRFVYEWRDVEGSFAGLRYLSRLGDEFENWAIFEPAAADEPPLVLEEVEVIDRDDPHLVEALRLLGLKME